MRRKRYSIKRARRARARGMKRSQRRRNKRYNGYRQARGGIRL